MIEVHYQEIGKSMKKGSGNLSFYCVLFLSTLLSWHKIGNRCPLLTGSITIRKSVEFLNFSSCLFVNFPKGEGEMI